MSILIKNVQVIDGTGKPPIKSDVLIKKNKISAIEDSINYNADEIIDGWGAYLSPGFIDINNHQDRYLNIFNNSAWLADKPLENFLSQGITTIIGGNGGFSLAPLIYGSLDFLKPWTDVKKINVNWHSVSEFLKSIKKIPLGTNFGTLAGFNAVYQELIAKKEKKLVPSVSKVLNFVLKEALKDGAFGISAGLDDIAIQEISYFEIKKIADLAAKYNKILSINLKNNKENLIDSVKKAIYLAKESKAKLLINNLFPLIGFESQYEEALDLIDKKPKNARIYFDFPICNSMVLSIIDFLPLWTRNFEKESIMENLKDYEFRHKILREIPKLTGEETIVVSPLIQNIVGKRLKEFSDNRGLDLKNGLLKLMEITELRAEIEVKNINIQKLPELLPNKNILISSNSSLLFSNVFKNFLEFSEKGNIISIEEAIRKITYLPARILGIEKRGEVRSGYFADLVIFKEGEIKEVILNGKRVIKDKKYNGISAGIPLF
ncbi:MAG: amidohydrolase family protein [Patescibacteria group bacterium]